MFRSDQQLAAVCQALCDRAQLGPMWTPAGPTDRAVRCIREDPGWSHGERLLFEVAWALWNGRCQPHLHELVAVLDGEHLAAVGSLLVAIAGGAAAVEAWLARQAVPLAGSAAGR